MKSSIVIAVLGAVFISAIALPEASIVVAEETAVHGMTWEGVVFPGAKAITLSGTAELIYEKILEMNPNFDKELGVDSDATDLDIAKSNSTQIDSIAKRAPMSPAGANCQIGHLTSGMGVPRAFDVLYKLGYALCHAGAGPGRCERVAGKGEYHNSAAVWLCNDKRVAQTIYCRDVAIAAEQIWNKCNFPYFVPNNKGWGGSWGKMVRGQLFSKGGTWNVIVGAYANHPVN